MNGIIHGEICPPPAPGRLATFVQMVAAFEIDEIEAAIAALIDELDARAGDPDLEPNGDESDTDGDDRDIAWREGGQHHDREITAHVTEDDEEVPAASTVSVSAQSNINVGVHHGQFN